MANERTASAAGMGAILAAAVPVGRGVQALCPREGRLPASAAPEGRVVDFERRGQLPRDERAWKREEPGARAERSSNLAAELRRRHWGAVRHQVGAIRSEERR